ncbi:Rieske 2Fe-2S domain-containing protein, partial [Rhizobium ruizarguesonis]
IDAEPGKDCHVAEPDDRFADLWLIGALHQRLHLLAGNVMDEIIECPKHNGRFKYKTGEAKGAPVCVNLKTYPVKIED